MSSHVATDLTNASGYRALCFSDADLLTAFGNDFGYENWVVKAFEYYGDPSDTAILISSSGQSQNMVNAARYAREHDMAVVTVSGFSAQNPLRTLGDVNLWTDNSEYNVVEMTHHIWLLAIVEYLVEERKKNEKKGNQRVKILVTGSQGYIGSVLTHQLLARGHEVTGIDIGYFDDCVLRDNHETHRFFQKDIRDVSHEDVEGYDAIVHLAALSNDPLGELAPGLTEEINLGGTLALARLAREAGVARFVYSSSQSMYGVSLTDSELDEYDSDKNPLTAYARTKWEAERELNGMQAPGFDVCSFRPSTVFGASARLRCDIVFNNLVACAYTTKRIEIKSDGTPWRPVVHIKDVCSAYIAGLEAPRELIAGKAFNVGIPNGNFTVKELAEAAQRAVPGSDLVFTGEHGSDSRTYRVSFRRILDELGDYYKPEWDLDRGGAELVGLFDAVGFSEDDFRGRKTNRLRQLNYLMTEGSVDSVFRRTGYDR